MSENIIPVKASTLPIYEGNLNNVFGIGYRIDTNPKTSVRFPLSLLNTGGGNDPGTGIQTIQANTLAFFDTFLNIGFYENTGYLCGTYSGRFRAPYFDQRVDTIDKIYIRTIDVSNPNAAIPPFTVYGTSQVSPVVVDAEEITLILGHLSYTIKVSDADNWKISCNTNGGSVIFPSLGDVTKSMTFIVPSTSFPITFNGVLIPAGNTVFAIYTLGAWTIDSTVVDIPVIPNYSDISVKKIITNEVVLSASTNGTFRITNAIVDTLGNGDLFLIAKQSDFSTIGIYTKIVKIGTYNLIKMLVSGIALNTVRVSGDGAYENKFDGFDPSTVLFEKIGITPVYMTGLIKDSFTSFPQAITSEGENIVTESGKKLSVVTLKDDIVAAIPTPSDGDDGITPHIGVNGNWYIGTTDTGISAQGLTVNQSKILNTIPLVCSDEVTDITSSTSVRKNRYVFQTAQSFTNIVGELIVPAVGGTFTVIVKKNGVSIFSTNLTFNSGASTTRTATVPVVLTTNPISFAIGDYVEVFVTGVGSITPGQGLTIYLM